MGEASTLNFKRELEALQTLRDELKVKAHLAKADAKDEIDKLEIKWHQLEDELKRAAAHAREPLGAIGEQAKVLARELKQSYERVMNQLS